MNLELETILRRVETLERQARAWKLLVVVSIVLAFAALAAPILAPGLFGQGASGAANAKFSVVEANRFLLRDATGRLAGGLEGTRDGTLHLVLGRGDGAGGSVFLEAQPNGVAHLTLRGPNGGIRAALLGTRTPSLGLASENQPTGVAITAQASGLGTIRLTDAGGRTRFRAP